MGRFRRYGVWYFEGFLKCRYVIMLIVPPISKQGLPLMKAITDHFPD